MEWPKELLELFDDPLLDGVRPKAAAVTADDRTQRKIEELRTWVDENGREPDVNSKNIKEKLLAVALRTLKEQGLWM
ncbi:MAG: hypothetical protein MJZ35_08855 [Bacteroidaceae bacterium]|nr:hypothetical protein [Bacteroidaceae bacterium]